MRTAALSGSITLNPGGGIDNGPDGLEIDLHNKGDILTSDGTTVVAFPAGANGQLLESRSTEPDGLRWVTQVLGETPAGLVDGSNDTYGLSVAPVPLSVELYVNGVIQTQGASFDYTLSGSTITFVTAAIPQVGDIVRVNFRSA